MKCRYCERDVVIPCRNSRCMEDADDRYCFDALMRSGGGEYVVNQQESTRRAAAFEQWKLRR